MRMQGGFLIGLVALLLGALPAATMNSASGGQVPRCQAELPHWEVGYWWGYHVQGLIEALGAWGEVFRITQADRYEHYVLGVREVAQRKFYVSSTIIRTDRGPLVGLSFTPVETMEADYSYGCVQSGDFQLGMKRFLSFPLWVGKRWTVVPEMEYQGRRYPPITAEVVELEEASLPMKPLPTFKIEYRQGDEPLGWGWWSPHFANWAKLSWEWGREGGPGLVVYELSDFWWLSPREALNRTYEALEEAIEVFFEQALFVLALLIEYDFEPERAWAILEKRK